MSLNKPQININNPFILVISLLQREFKIGVKLKKKNNKGINEINFVGENVTIVTQHVMAGQGTFSGTEFVW